MATLNYFDPSTGEAKSIDMSADGAVWVGPEAPTDPAYSLWIDTDDFSDVAVPSKRNRIINGDFTVNQRGATSATTLYAFVHDRWQNFCGGGTVTYSAQSPALGELPESARSFARVAVSGQSAAGDFAELVQAIESVRTLSGKTTTVSFWAKAASGTPKVALAITQNFGTGGSPSASVDTYIGQVTLSTTWTRYSLTFNMPSIAGKVLGSTLDTDGLTFRFWLSSGSTYNANNGSLGIQTNTFDFWGVQWEEGSTATPYEQKSYAAELYECQRFFERYTYANTASGNNIPHSPMRVDTVDRPMCLLHYKEKRVAPTISISSYTHFQCIPLTAAGASNPVSWQGTLVGTGRKAACIYFTGTWTIFMLCHLIISNSAGYIDISAEM